MGVTQHSRHSVGRVAMAGVAACLVLVIQACTNVSQGTPSAASSTSTPSVSTSAPTTSPTGAAASPLDNVDPCTLLTTDELAQLGFPPAHRNAPLIAGRVSCSSATPQASIGVYVDVKRGLADLNTNGASRVEDRTVGDRQGRLVEKPGGYCDVDLAVAAKASVTVSMAAFKNQAQACTVAESAAALVEPRLPRG
jgi:Protein of unknown function (DUF3558)